MATITRRMTVAELERDGAPEGCWELIDGELVEMPPAGEEHGHTWGAIYAHIWNYVIPLRLGRVFGADTGFAVSLDRQMVRVPDAGFVRAERLDPDRDRKRFLRVPPDLAVEVVSPGDRMSEAVAKAAMWLDAGSTIVWVVDPAAETVTVFRQELAPRIYRRDDTLDGGEVLPGFALAVRDIFAD
ncbi:MAG: Uma2 family endonuclease [Chloroflexota bacterium]|nr:Uma2 family endonuclease [Chloroflexota bacterium]